MRVLFLAPAGAVVAASTQDLVQKQAQKVPSMFNALYDQLKHAANALVIEGREAEKLNEAAACEYKEESESSGKRQVELQTENEEATAASLVSAETYNHLSSGEDNEGSLANLRAKIDGNKKMLAQTKKKQEEEETELMNELADTERDQNVVSDACESILTGGSLVQVSATLHTLKQKMRSKKAVNEEVEPEGQTFRTTLGPICMQVEQDLETMLVDLNNKLKNVTEERNKQRAALEKANAELAEKLEAGIIEQKDAFEARNKARKLMSETDHAIKILIDQRKNTHDKVYKAKETHDHNQNMRNLEMGAIRQTLDVLKSTMNLDESGEMPAPEPYVEKNEVEDCGDAGAPTFTHSFFPTTFMQTSSSHNSVERRSSFLQRSTTPDMNEGLPKALALLYTQAKDLKAPALMSLAASVRSAIRMEDDGTSGHEGRKKLFMDLYKKIETMIVDLEKQAKEEDAKYEQCTGTLTKIQNDRRLSYKTAKEMASKNLEIMAQIQSLEAKNSEDNSLVTEMKEIASAKKTTLSNVKGMAEKEQAEQETAVKAMEDVLAAMNEFYSAENQSKLSADNENADRNQSGSAKAILALIQQLKATAAKAVEDNKLTVQETAANIDALVSQCTAQVESVRKEQAEDVVELKELDDNFVNAGSTLSMMMTQYLGQTRKYIDVKYEDEECAETQLSKAEEIAKMGRTINILKDLQNMLNDMNLDDANTGDSK